MSIPVEPQGIRYKDLSGREMLLIQDESLGEFNGWLCYRHPDGQWVSMCKAEDWQVREIKARAKSMPTLAEAVRRLRTVQRAWNNTHSRRESNTWEAFEVVLSALEHVINNADDLHAALHWLAERDHDGWIDIGDDGMDAKEWKHLRALEAAAKSLVQ